QRGNEARDRCVVVMVECAQVDRVDRSASRAAHPIASTATVSTTGATGCLTFRAAFFTGVRLGFAFATVFACAALRALPRLAEVPLRGFARFCSFDLFLRFAMIVPRFCCDFSTHCSPIY